jgi:hypothetical protein
MWEILLGLAAGIGLMAAMAEDSKSKASLEVSDDYASDDYILTRSLCKDGILEIKWR